MTNEKIVKIFCIFNQYLLQKIRTIRVKNYTSLFRNVLILLLKIAPRI